ncbi:uncharacterized protein LOC142571366 [Dermacentor variabilis]|uniref:uncharacterized protein LOC142571366 n=1 Tax=Dermacentor variabilis TaxID=34621 RepID=UPI003F5AE093
MTRALGARAPCATIFVITHISLSVFLEAAKFDECGPKPGVVTTAKAASMGASLLAKCGRNLLLKHSIRSETLSKGFAQSCVVLQMCNAHNVHLREKKNTFVDAMMHCFLKTLQLIAKVHPEVLGSFSGSLNEVMNTTANCVKGDFLGGDIRISLAVVRYVRSVIFMNGKG